MYSLSWSRTVVIVVVYAKAESLSFLGWLRAHSPTGSTGTPRFPNLPLWEFSD